MKLLSVRLRDRELIPVEIHRLIKDVSRAAGNTRPLEPADLKQDLARLGWEAHILDNRTLLRAVAGVTPKDR